MEDSDNSSVSHSSSSSSDESEAIEEDLTTTKQDEAKMVDAIGVVIRGITQKVVRSREEARERELNERVGRLEQELLAKLAKAQDEILVLSAEGKKRNIAFVHFEMKHDKEIKDLKTQVSSRDEEISYLETNYNSCKEEITKLKAESKLVGKEMQDMKLLSSVIVSSCKNILSTLSANDEGHKKDILELKQQVQENIQDAAPSSSSATAALRNMTEDEKETAILSSSAEGEIDGVHFVMTGSKEVIQGIKSTCLGPDDIQVVIVSKPERFLLRFKQEDGNFICSDCGNSSDRYHFFNLHRKSQRCRGRIVDGVIISKEMLKEIKSPRFNLATSCLKFKEESSESGEMPGGKGLKRKADDNY